MPEENNVGEKNVKFNDNIKIDEIEQKFSLEKEDYLRILNIIASASNKGAFSADELYLTGLTYERIKKYLSENFPDS